MSDTALMVCMLRSGDSPKATVLVPQCTDSIWSGEGGEEKRGRGEEQDQHPS